MSVALDAHAQAFGVVIENSSNGSSTEEHDSPTNGFSNALPIHFGDAVEETEDDNWLDATIEAVASQPFLSRDRARIHALENPSPHKTRRWILYRALRIHC